MLFLGLGEKNSIFNISQDKFSSLSGNFPETAVMVTPLSYETDILRFGLDECIINWL